MYRRTFLSLNCTWMCLLFFKFSLLLLLNRALIDNSTCSTGKVYPV